MGNDYGVDDAASIENLDEEADVVSMGLGAAGSCAAIEARADVLVLERASGGG